MKTFPPEKRGGSSAISTPQMRGGRAPASPRRGGGTHQPKKGKQKGIDIGKNFFFGASLKEKSKEAVVVKQREKKGGTVENGACKLFRELRILPWKGGGKGGRLFLRRKRGWEGTNQRYRNPLRKRKVRSVTKGKGRKKGKRACLFSAKQTLRGKKGLTRESGYRFGKERKGKRKGAPASRKKKEKAAAPGGGEKRGAVRL